MKTTFSLLTGLLVGCLTLAACGRDFRAPNIDESGSETGTEVQTPAPSPAPSAPSAPREPAATVATRTLSLDQSTNVRKLSASVLEFVAELPPGSKVSVPVDYLISQPDVRNSTGAIERSSTGFVGSVQIVSTPAGAGHLTSTQISTFNKLGLYLSASVVAGSDGAEGSFTSLSGAANGAGFLSKFASNGKPKFSYTASVTKRFGTRLNRAIEAADVDKSRRVFAELAHAADRKVATPKSFILMDRATAARFSLAYEKNGTVSPNGAWTIAVTSTAVRHGFENVPCAEFVSEAIREAYQRAGYSASTDFGAKNQLIWSRTASVEGLSTALYAAGWSAWEPSKYRPPTGAIMMHGAGQSPGHTYLAAGDDGRIVVDNGSPQGRDLRSTTAATLEMMYETGVFFLPPGITPKPW